MTDNAWAYRYGRDYQVALAEIGARRVFIPPYSPQINGKVERFNRTLLEEWAYSQPFTSNQQRHHLLEAWLHRYNYHRTHTALKRPLTHRPCQQPVWELQQAGEGQLAPVAARDVDGRIVVTNSHKGRGGGGLMASK